MQLTEPLDIEYSDMPQLLKQSHSLPWNYCQPVTENSTHTSPEYFCPIWDSNNTAGNHSLPNFASSLSSLLSYKPFSVLRPLSFLPRGPNWHIQ